MTVPSNISKVFFMPFLLVLFGCLEEVTYDGFNEKQLDRILSNGDTLKTWQRISLRKNGQRQELESCDLNHQLLFGQSGTNNTAYFVKQVLPLENECNLTKIQLLDSGNYSIQAESPQPDTLWFNNESGSNFQIIERITSEFLTLKSFENVSGNEKVVILEGYEAVENQPPLAEGNKK